MFGYSEEVSELKPAEGGVAGLVPAAALR